MGSSWSGCFCDLVAGGLWLSPKTWEKVLANESECKSRSGSKETSINCLRPAFDNGAEIGTVKMGDKIRQNFHVMDAVDEGQADGGRFSGTDAW